MANTLKQRVDNDATLSDSVILFFLRFFERYGMLRVLHNTSYQDIAVSLGRNYNENRVRLKMRILVAKNYVTIVKVSRDRFHVFFDGGYFDTDVKTQHQDIPVENDGNNVETQHQYSPPPTPEPPPLISHIDTNALPLSPVSQATESTSSVNVDETPENKPQSAENKPYAASNNPFAKWLNADCYAAKTPVVTPVKTDVQPQNFNTKTPSKNQNLKPLLISNSIESIDYLYLKSIDSIPCPTDKEEARSARQFNSARSNSIPSPQGKEEAQRAADVKKSENAQRASAAAKKSIESIDCAEKNKKSPFNSTNKDKPRAETSQSLYQKVRAVAPDEKQTYLAFMVEAIEQDKAIPRKTLEEILDYALKANNPGAYLNAVLKNMNGENEFYPKDYYEYKERGINRYKAERKNAVR
jgi:hypothetical protein